MSFQKEVSNALSYITANGYQIHPEAFKILKNLNNSNIMDIIQKVVRLKKTQNDNSSIILIEDLQNFCTINISTESDNLTAADSMKILHNTLKKIMKFKNSKLSLHKKINPLKLFMIQPIILILRKELMDIFLYLKVDLARL